jgi:hypothetical protein
VLSVLMYGILEKSNNLSQVTDKLKRTKRDICKTRCPEELSEPPVSIHQNLHYFLLVILHTIKFVSTFTSLVLWESCLLFMRFEWFIVGSNNVDSDVYLLEVHSILLDILFCIYLSLFFSVCQWLVTGYCFSLVYRFPQDDIDVKLLPKFHYSLDS